jgi:hypothetical protein
MASYVFVWENNTPGHQKVPGYTWPGHSSMNIGDLFDSEPEMSLMFNSYVSWWPGEGADFSVKGIVKSLFQKAQKGDRNATIIEDVNSEGYLPDHVIKLDSTGTQEANMKAAWLTVAHKKGGSSYKNLRKNCSTIVSRVLHAGGYYAKKWAIDTNFAWSPADVRRLADAAGGTHMTWVDFLEVLKKSNITAKDFPTTNARSGVYCSTGAPCDYQKTEKWKPDSTKGK